MPSFSREQLDAYEAMLSERVFQTRKWPHFAQLLRDVRRLAGNLARPLTAFSVGFSIVARKPGRPS